MLLDIVNNTAGETLSSASVSEALGSSPAGATALLEEKLPMPANEAGAEHAPQPPIMGESSTEHKGSPRDHVEVSSGCNFAAVSDRGLRHHDNQDSIALSTVEILVSPVDVPPIYIAVICDGVSSCESGASASEIAAQATAASLKSAFTRNPCANPRNELFLAIRKANEAVCAIPCDPNMEKDPPSTTVVAAVVVEGQATIGWVGDSRAYWVDEEDAGVLTRDDSWINAMLDAGYMTEEEAKVNPNQSALYRCLGGELCDDGPNADPSFANFFVRPGTRLILCSDGFWNYAPTPDDVARVARQGPVDDAFKTAKHMVNFAIVGGGHDNISVAVLSL